jgi:hypothetical protein
MSTTQRLPFVSVVMPSRKMGGEGPLPGVSYQEFISSPGDQSEAPCAYRLSGTVER